MRMHLCDTAKGRRAVLKQLVDKLERILVQEKGYKVKNFAEICQFVPKLDLELKKADLSPEFCDLQVKEHMKYCLYL